MGESSDELKKINSHRKSVVNKQSNTFMDTLVQRYRYVSLFQWYTPKKLKKLNAKNLSVCVPYNNMHKSQLSRIDQGYNFFLKENSQILVDLNKQDIIPSYEINIPLKVDLLCLKDLTQKI